MRPPATELSLEACLDRHRLSGGRSSLAVVATVDSTNRLAREVARAYLADDCLPPQLVLLAREQTAGRGRRGRSWHSPAGQGIYTSLLLSMPDSEALAALPLRVPLALCEVLDDLGVDCAIKWPNDLVVGGRKLGGVLIEALAGPRAVIVGYGINGSQEEAELPQPDATSLRLLTGTPRDLSSLAVDLAEAVVERLTVEEPVRELVRAYAGRSVHRPGDRLSCRQGDEVEVGRFVGFDESGRLRLRTDEGERVFSSAEMLSARGAAETAGNRDAPGE